MFYDGKIWMAVNEEPQSLLLQMANRHGLICGATGTGKTTTLKVMAESFSDAGVPVFISDIKGDLSGMSQPGESTDWIKDRAARYGLVEKGYVFKGFPTRYWDVFGEKGAPVRATISEMGPLLLGRIMGLNDVQEGVLSIIFRIADDQGLLLLDLKDLRAMAQHVGENAEQYKTQYGNIATATIGTIQREILRLEDQGAENFFAEPALDLADWIACDADGRGYLNVLNCEKLFQQPLLYSTFLLWMLAELYETLPEVGDLDKPRMVFFFDEAHLLFNDCPKELLSKIEQVVRLIRSKGVGVYFITQNPTDIPDTVLSQLGNRIEHALRAYSPADLKNVNAAAQGFRQNPAFDTVTAIQELETGEALVQFLDASGAPNIVQRAYILPPQSRMGVLDEALFAQVVAADPMTEKYAQAYDRASAYEILTGKVTATPAPSGGVEIPVQASAVPVGSAIAATAAPAPTVEMPDAVPPTVATAEAVPAPQAPVAVPSKVSIQNQATQAAYAAAVAALAKAGGNPTGDAMAAATPIFEYYENALKANPDTSEKPFTTAEIKSVVSGAIKQAENEKKAAEKDAAAKKKEEEKKEAEKNKLVSGLMTSGAKSFASAAGRQFFRSLLGILKK